MSNNAKLEGYTNWQPHRQERKRIENVQEIPAEHTARLCP
jgi:hypothetical protein